MAKYGIGYLGGVVRVRDRVRVRLTEALTQAYT